MALTRKDRLRAEDLEECGRVGEEFGLGDVEAVAREWGDRSGLRWIGGSVLASGFLGLWVVWPIVSGVTGSVSLYLVEIFGTLLVAGGPLMIIGKRLANVATRLCLYTGGLARIDRTAAEPAVLRWADVETVTIGACDEGAPTLTSCTLSGRAGVVMTAGPEICEQVAVAAYRALAPRIAAAMIAAYDCGQAVAVSADAQVSQWGIVFPRKNRLPWTDIGVVIMEHPSAAALCVTTRMDLRKGRKGSHHYCDPSGVPNGIFLADLIAHAARQRGVLVEGYTVQEADC
jgi:hypothetical protein